MALLEMQQLQDVPHRQAKLPEGTL
jgi:hypothetical protein